MSAGKDWTRARATEIIRPYLEHGASKFDALLGHDIEVALLRVEAETIEKCVKICEKHRDSGNPSTWVAEICAREIRALVKP